jgi:YVTN family beta-propeller protein
MIITKLYYYDYHETLLLTGVKLNLYIKYKQLFYNRLKLYPKPVQICNSKKLRCIILGLISISILSVISIGTISGSRGISGHVYIGNSISTVSKKSSSIDYWRAINAWMQQQQRRSSPVITIIPNAKAENSSNNISKIGKEGQALIGSSGAGTAGQPGVAVDSYPIGVAVNPVTKNVYVTNEFSNTVSVIDGGTQRVTDTITVGSFPYGVAVNPFNDRIYVTNRGSNTVTVIDSPTNTKLSDISVGNSPVGIAVNPSSNWIYVTNINSGTVSVIDGITNKVTNTITVGKAPYGVSVNPLTNKIYVTNIQSSTVSVIDGSINRVITTIPVGKSPVCISASTISNMVYVTNHLSNTVSVIDGKTNKVSATIAVGKSPVGISVNPVTNKIYVANIQSSTVSAIDGRVNKITGSITVNPSLRRVEGTGDPVLNMPILTQFPLIASLVAVNSVSDVVYVTNTGSNTLSIIDGSKDQVIVRIAFDVNPPDVGNIQCNGQQILSNSSIVVNNGAHITCMANSSHGYKFSSWSGLVDSSADNPIHFTASNYGTLTANFQQSLSVEQYLAIILGPVSVVSIVVSWLFRSRQRRYLNKYVIAINSVYDNFLYKNREGNSNNRQQEYLLRLDGVRKEITQLYIKGRISDAHYNVLDKIISDYMAKADKK